MKTIPHYHVVALRGIQATLFRLTYLYFLILWGTGYYVCVEVRGQFVGIPSCLLLGELRKLNNSHEVLWQVS